MSGRYEVKNLKLSCEYKGKTLSVREACNTLILSSENSGSYGGIDYSAMYLHCVNNCGLSDLRPWLPAFKNFDCIGEHTDWADKWWKTVDEQYDDPEFWRRQAREMELELKKFFVCSLEIKGQIERNIEKYSGWNWKYPIDYKQEE